MSFMSCSVTGTKRREFVFDGPQGSGQEYQELRSERFERKGFSSKNRKVSEDLIITHYRDNGDLIGEEYALPEISDHSCGPVFEQAALENDADLLIWASSIVSESPTARLLYIHAKKAGWRLRAEDLSGAGCDIDPSSRLIILDHYGFTASALGRSSHLSNLFLVNFIKALRQVWHEMQNYDHLDIYRPDALMMLDRARAADCETTAILAGWELRGAGYVDIWRTILGSDEGDMAMIFTRAIEKDPAGFYDGSVLTRTFCQWYNDAGRVTATDHACLERLDHLLREFGKKFGEAGLKANAIEAMSELPGGKAYLAGMGENLCSDPYFTAIDDPINEAHLFQVAYDSRVVLAGGVPFRDSKLARMIFPGELVKIKE